MIKNTDASTDKKTAPLKKRRPKGDGSVQQLAKDKYKIQITVGYDQDGHQIRKSFTGKTQRDVIAMLNKFRSEKQLGTLVAPTALTLRDYIARWLAAKKITVKAKSYATYKFSCEKHIIPTLGDFKVQKVTTSILNDYFVAKATAGLASASLAQHRAILSGIMTLAVAEGVIGTNPVALVSSIPKTRSRQVVLSDEQMQKLLHVARTYNSVRQGMGLHCIYHIILLALATGMRRGELLAVQWRDIDLTHNTLSVVDNLVEIKGKQVLDTPKSDNGIRTFSVEPKVLQLLRAELWTTAEGLVFQKDQGQYIPFTNLTSAYKRCLELAGIPRQVRLHDLRHTHVTHLLANHYDIKLVSQRIGDDPKTVMNTYAHVMPHKDKEASKFMGSKLFTAPLLP
jgi:integrase